MDRTDYQILNLLQADSRTTLKCIGDKVGLTAIFPEKYNPFCKFCEETSSIIAHHHLVGKLNALLRFAVRDTHQLDQLLAALKQFGDSQTSVELSAYFERKDVPLPK